LWAGGHYLTHSTSRAAALMLPGVRRFASPIPPLVVAKSTRALGLRLLGVWFLVWSLFRFVNLSFAYDHLVLPVLGLVVGVLLLIGS